MSAKPCAVPNCSTYATEHRIDARRRAPERLNLCVTHAAQHDRMLQPRRYCIADDFDPDDTATSPHSTELRYLEITEAGLLQNLRRIQRRIREIRNIEAA